MLVIIDVNILHVLKSDLTSYNLFVLYNIYVYIAVTYEIEIYIL